MISGSNSFLHAAVYLRAGGGTVPNGPFHRLPSLPSAKTSFADLAGKPAGCRPLARGLAGPSRRERAQGAALVKARCNFWIRRPPGNPAHTSRVYFLCAF